MASTLTRSFPENLLRNELFRRDKAYAKLADRYLQLREQLADAHDRRHLKHVKEAEAQDRQTIQEALAAGKPAPVVTAKAEAEQRRESATIEADKLSVMVAEAVRDLRAYVGEHWSSLVVPLLAAAEDDAIHIAKLLTEVLERARHHDLAAAHINGMLDVANATKPKQVGGGEGPGGKVAVIQQRFGWQPILTVTKRHHLSGTHQIDLGEHLAEVLAALQERLGARAA